VASIQKSLSEKEMENEELKRQLENAITVSKNEHFDRLQTTISEKEVDNKKLRQKIEEITAKMASAENAIQEELA